MGESNTVVSAYTSYRHLTLSQTTNLESSKLKEFADDNFKVDENCKIFF